LVGRASLCSAKMAGMVQLELDEKDKESFNEMQQSLSQAQQELSMVQTKARMRENEQRRAELTLAELQEMPDDTISYTQVGKMFLQKPLDDLKKEFSDKATSCQKERDMLGEKKAHVEDALKKVNDDFQEFVRAHLVSKEAAAS